LRAFDSAGMALLETAMWRDYYEKRYGALFYHLYELSRTQFGFSPLDSLRIALAAASAAKAFQPTRSRSEAAAALPELAVYYALLRRRRRWRPTRTSWRAWNWIGGRRGARRSDRAITAAPSPRSPRSPTARAGTTRRSQPPASPVPRRWPIATHAGTG